VYPGPNSHRLYRIVKVNFAEFPFRNCLIIPEEPRFGVLGEAPTRPEAPFRRRSCHPRQPLRAPKRFIRQFLHALR
jgi:hypothetical protein